MDPLSITASIIAVLQLSDTVISYCYGFNLQVKDADNEISEIVTELKLLQDLLNQTRAVLPVDDRAENAELEGIYAALVASNNIIEEISKKLAPLLKKGLRSRLKWPFEGKVIKEKLERLRKKQTIFQSFFSLRHAKLLEVQSDNIEKALNHADEARRTKILSWYKTSDPEQNHKASRDHHAPQTCNWVSELDAFKSFASRPGESFWMHGIPGAGKTIICSTIIEQIKADRSSKLVYYYFDFSDTRKQKLSSFLQSAIYQLLVVCEEIPEAAAKLYDKHLGLQQPSAEELFKVFASIISSEKVFIIVDAIDECSKQERANFFRIFVNQITSVPGASLLMTSRREPDIEKAIRGNFTHVVSIEDSQVDADVRIHVTNTLATDSAFENWSPALKKEVLEAIVKGSRGMFRWAFCQLEVMKQSLTARMVRTKLSEMPKTLDQTYDRILDAVPAMHKTFVQSALRWLAFSDRPLLVSELGEAAVIDPTFGPFDDESRFLDPGKILELCGSLIIVSHKTYGLELSKTNDWLFIKLRNEDGPLVRRENGEKYPTVALSHYSVKEYLISERLREGSLNVYSMTEKMAHSFLTECSILYLLGLGGGQIQSKRVFNEYPLLEYCSRNWMKHCRKGEDTANIIDLLVRFFDPLKQAAYINWRNAYEPDDDAPGNDNGKRFWRHDLIKSIPQTSRALYWAVQLGYTSIVSRLIENGIDVNGPGIGYFGSPLGVAGFYGFDKIVKLLLENGADPNGKGGEFGSVLQASAAGGSCKVVEILVAAGADIGKTGGRWNTALVAAATFGHDEVVSFLLKSRSDITVKSNVHGSALYQAALKGDVKTTVRLLGAGADINEVGPKGTPIFAAASSGSLNLVQILLNRGADVNRGGSKGYPLNIAAKRGNTRVVQALLKAGAKVNPQTDSFGRGGASALEAAIVSRDLPTFKLILDAGGDPNIPGDIYQDCLYAALWTGELDMARILLEKSARISDGTFLEAVARWRQDPSFLTTILERGPNIDAHLGNEGGALHIAIRKATEEAVWAILARNPYIEPVSERGTPLTCALSEGMTDVAKELIKLGADIHREIPDYCCPLKASILQGGRSSPPNFEMADMLLNMGVDINCAKGRTVMSAIDFNNVPAVRYLGEHGADINSVNEYNNCTPLQQAAMRGDMKMLEALLDLGVDVNGPPGKYGTALHYAFFGRKNKEEVVEYLLVNGATVEDPVPECGIIYSAFENGFPNLVRKFIELGADVNKVSGKGWTPLAMAIKERNDEMKQLLRRHGARATSSGAAALMTMFHSNNIEGVEELLAEGVDPNVSEFWESPINAAIEAGRRDTVELLIAHGASLDFLPDVHLDPLTKAVESNDKPMVEYLLSMGADPSQGKSGTSWALAQAVKEGNIEIFDILLDSGADVMGFGGYAFKNAVWGGEEMLQHLMAKVAPPHREEALDAVLQEAIYWAKVDLCRLLLDMGANADFAGGEYGSPLHAAVSHFHSTNDASSNNQRVIFDMLLQEGAKPKEVENHPSTLLLAMKNVENLYVFDLLKAGGDPNGRGDDKYGSPLQAAARYAPSLLELLIRAGAEVNAVGGKFGTALHVAAHTLETSRIAILLKHGARTDLMSQKYGGVIQAAAKCKGKREADLLSEEKSVQAMRLLHSHGASVNVIGGMDGNALQIAARTGNLEGLKWLLEHGANPDAKGRQGTALEAAIAKKKWRIVSYLEQRYGRMPSANAPQ